MTEKDDPRPPPALGRILQRSAAIGFGLASEAQTGSLLRALAASKPGGCVLEIGTGTGVGTAWLLDGMDDRSTLDSIDHDDSVQAVARQCLGHDRRVRFLRSDAAEFLAGANSTAYDLIFADAWPGKYTHLDLALRTLRHGGIYVIDDLLPQPNWPDGHAARIAPLINDLKARPGFVTTRLAWASGMMLVVRR